MRITNIKLTQKANLGNYESMEFTAEAVIDLDEESVDAATRVLADYVDWNAQMPIRESKARVYRQVLADENAPADKKAEAEKWMAKYEERKARVEAM